MRVRQAAKDCQAESPWFRTSLIGAGRGAGGGGAEGPMGAGLDKGRRLKRYLTDQDLQVIRKYRLKWSLYRMMTRNLITSGNGAWPTCGAGLPLQASAPFTLLGPSGCPRFDDLPSPYRRVPGEGPPGGWTGLSASRRPEEGHAGRFGAVAMGSLKGRYMGGYS